MRLDIFLIPNLKKAFRLLLLGVILAVGFVDVLYEVDEVFCSWLLNFYQEWTLDFVKCFFLNCQGDHIILFGLSSVCEYVNTE